MTDIKRKSYTVALTEGIVRNTLEQERVLMIQNVLMELKPKQFEVLIFAMNNLNHDIATTRNMADILVCLDLHHEHMQVCEMLKKMAFGFAHPELV